MRLVARSGTRMMSTGSRSPLNSTAPANKSASRRDMAFAAGAPRRADAGRGSAFAVSHVTRLSDNSSRQRAGRSGHSHSISQQTRSRLEGANVTNVLRAVAGVLMVGLMSPSRAYADPVTITSGVLAILSGSVQRQP